MTSSGFGLGPLGQVAQPTQDLERAKVFYRDVLGMRHLFDAPRMAFFDMDGVRLMLAAPEEEGIRSGGILYFRVDDVDAAHETLSGRGVTFELPPTLIAEMGDHELWMTFFRDPEGNLLALMEERSTT